MNRDMLSRRLNRRGFETLIAVDAEQGIEAAVKHAPDLILMDISLPGMDGWTATRVLKSTPSTASIPVIALTAHALSSDRDRARDAGCDEFETKPVELTALISKIERLLGRTTLPTDRSL